jgi:hypothetical protein
MEITKKQWTIIAVVIAIVAIWYFFLRKKKAESGYGVGIKTPAGTYTGGKLGMAIAGTGTGIKRGGGGVSNKPTCPYGRCATWTLLGGWFCGPCATAAGSTTTTTQA